MSRPRQPWFRSLIGLAACVACAAGDASPVADAGQDRPGPIIRFRVAADGIPLGDIPFPDDLYLPEGGGPRLEPSDWLSDTALSSQVRQDHFERGGFSPRLAVRFRVEGDVDPASLPASAAASMLPDASVFLLDIDPGSSAPFTRVPVQVTWQPERSALRVMPQAGEVLRGGQRYAVVVTTEVRAPDGEPMRPDDAYQRVLAAANAPSDPDLGRVYRAHINALLAIENIGIARDRIAGLAVFTVRDVATELRALVEATDAAGAPAPAVSAVYSGAALDAVLGSPPPGSVGLMPGGGVAHENVGWMVQGTVLAPNYLSGVAEQPGHFTWDEARRPIARRQEVLPFTLCLPAVPGSDEITSLPLVVFQHGLGRDRADMLPLANELNAAGYAVIAIDAPFHGLRQPAAEDLETRLAERPLPDGFLDADTSASARYFLGADVPGLDRVAWHPSFVRDALRQNVSDWRVVLRALAANPSEWLATAGVSGVSLVLDRVAFIGVDVGATTGLLLGGVDDAVIAHVAVAPVCDVGEWLLRSPQLAPEADALMSALGIGAGASRAEAVTSLEFELWQSLVSEADPLAWAPALRRKRSDLLLVAVQDDETVTHHVTEALAAALRIPRIGASSPRYVELTQATAPLSHNMTIGGELATQALFEHASGAHDLYVVDAGQQRFERPADWPFTPLAVPVEVANPIDGALTQAVFFLESWRMGAATIVDPNAQLQRAAQ